MEQPRSRRWRSHAHFPYASDDGKYELTSTCNYCSAKQMSLVNFQNGPLLQVSVHFPDFESSQHPILEVKILGRRRKLALAKLRKLAVLFAGFLAGWATLRSS